MTSEANKGVFSLGWKYALLFAVTTVVELALSAAVKAIWPNMSDTFATNASLIIIIISVNLIGFPLIALLTKDTPKTVENKNKIPFGQFLIGVCICFTFMYGGAIIGNIMQTITIGSAESPLAGIMSTSNIVLQVLEVGILAPIFEELLFRKILCGALSRYGKWFAVLTSGLAFGLYHGNFSQFFYAFLLGCFFGFVYLKTGNILYTIGYHMIVNLSSTLISMPLLQLSTKSAVASALYSLWAVLQILLAVAGLVLLIVFAKFIRLDDESSEIKKGGIFKAMFGNAGLWLLYLAGIGLFVLYIASTRGTRALGVAEVVNDVRFTEVITIDGDDASPTETVIPFTISETDEYVLYVDFMNNQAPSFITGVLVETADGRGIDFFTANLAFCELGARTYEAGEYKISFKYLPTEEDVVRFISDNAYIYGDEEVEAEVPFEGFGVPGTYTMNYHFVLSH